MSKVSVRYCHGFNISGTGQHEVLEYVVESDAEVHGVIEEGPYVVLYTEEPWTAQAIAALLNADGEMASPRASGAYFRRSESGEQPPTGSAFRPWEKYARPEEFTHDDSAAKHDEAGEAM